MRSLTREVRPWRRRVFFGVKHPRQLGKVHVNLLNRLQKLGLILSQSVLVAMPGSTAEARKLEDILRTGTLRICVAGSAARFYQHNGELFAQFLGVKPEILMLGDPDQQFQNADGIVVKDDSYEPKLLVDSMCDVFPNDLHAEPWRTSKMAIVPYYKTRKVVVAHRDLRSQLRKPEDLAGRSVAVPSATSYDAWVEEQNRSAFFANQMIVMHAPMERSVKLVADKDVDFTVIGSEDALGWVRTYLDELQVMFPLEKAIDVGWGIRRNAGTLQAQLQRFFEHSRRAGSDLDRSWQLQHRVSLMEYQRLDQFFDRDNDVKALLTWAWPVALVVALVLSAMTYWNRRLRREIEERMETEAKLAAARKVAEEATAAKSRFLANMSHEIRSPMNAIIGMAHLMSYTELAARQRDYLSKIQRAAQHLLSVINDILDLSKVEAGKLEVERREFELSGVLEDVASLIGDKARAKGLVLTFHINPDVPNALIGDPLRLGQILINYCNNAVKFTHRGEIHVRIELLEKNDDDQVLLYFAVADTGIGIPEQQKSRLFEAFQQTDESITRRYGGTGLGLAISKNLAELMNGAVGCESKEGEGSTFWFTARLREQPEQRSKRRIVPLSGAHTAVPQLSGARILLVEDDELNQEVATGLIVGTGASVDVAPNGAIAVERIKEGTYDLVLMDIQMPIMDGFSATRLIRELRGADRLPIVALTANVLPGDWQKCRAAGMNDCIGKPIDRDELFSVLRKWIPERVTRESARSAVQTERRTRDALAEVPGLDVQSGLRRVLGNHASYEDLLRKFCDRYPDAIANIRSDLTANDHAAAQRRAHTLKGLAGTIGATALERTAAHLEQVIKNDGAAVAIEAQLAAAQEELAQLIEALSQALPREDQIPEAATPVDLTRASQVLSRLESLLASHDAEAVEVCKWNAALLRSVYGAAFAPVENKIVAFMFPDALTELHNMKTKIAQLPRRPIATAG